jgi:hypothetical protein
MLFMCWTRETGVIPAALAGLLLGMKAPGAQTIASVTFIAILMTILIQAPTTEYGSDAGWGCWKRAGRPEMGPTHRAALAPTVLRHPRAPSLSLAGFRLVIA